MAYSNDFLMMMAAMVPAGLLLVLMRRPARVAAQAELHAAIE